MAAKASALDVFNSLTIDDVREQIAALDTQISELEKKRDSLRTIEKAIDIRDNGRPKKKWSRKPKQPANAASAGNAAATADADDEDDNADRARSAAKGAGRTPSPETVELRDRLHKVLRLRGPMLAGELSREVKLDYGTVSRALLGPQFRKLDDGRYTVK